MRTLQVYILRAFTTVFMTTLVVFTFVLCLAVVFKITDLLARGGSTELVWAIVSSRIPEALVFSIPMGVLTGCVLVFNRLSSDGEIVAMQACGISMWRIATIPIYVAVLMTVVCLHINSNVLPESHYRRSELVHRFAASPFLLFEAGSFVRDIEGLTFYIGKISETKEEDVARVQDVIMYDARDPAFVREYRADHGFIRIGKSRKWIRMTLQDVWVNPLLPDRPGPADLESCSLPPIYIGEHRRPYRRKHKDMSVAELYHSLPRIAELFPGLTGEHVRIQRMKHSVELNRRLVLSAFCLAFALLGVPLGIKGHRKESSVGIAVSLGIIFVCYLFIALAEALARRPDVPADIIVWLPFVGAAALGGYLIQRANACR